MSITKEAELVGMQNISEVVGTTLKLMRAYAQIGMSTKELVISKLEKTLHKERNSMIKETNRIAYKI